MTTYSLDLSALTVLATDSAGETFDLNASGLPCSTVDDLAAWTRELHEQGVYDADTRDELLAAITGALTRGGILCDYRTADAIRPATTDEIKASIAAARTDGGAGVIEVNGRSCYVAPTF